jgi:hypothetical protein
MIKPEIDLELSINTLRVYGIEPNIIKSMLSNLQKIVNKNCNIPDVMKSVCECADQHEEGIVWGAKTGRYIKCKCQQTVL